MTDPMFGILVLSFVLTVVLASRARNRDRTVEWDKRVESSLARVLSAPSSVDPADLRKAPQDIHRLGERVLDALQAERRASDWLAECPHDRARIDDWLTCRQATIRLERQYAQLACEAESQVHSIPKSWSPRVRLHRLALVAPHPSMRPHSRFTLANGAVLSGLPSPRPPRETAS